MKNLPEIKSTLIALIDSEKKSTYEYLDYSSMMKTLGADKELLTRLAGACKSNIPLMRHLHFACLSAHLVLYKIIVVPNPRSEVVFMDESQDVEQWNLNAYKALKSKLGATNELAALNIELLKMACALPIILKREEPTEIPQPTEVTPLITKPSEEPASFDGLTKAYNETKFAITEMLRQIEVRAKNKKGDTSKIQADIKECRNILSQSYPNVTALTVCSKKIESAMRDSYAWDNDDRKILDAAFYGLLALAVVGCLLAALAAAGPGGWILITALAFTCVGFVGAGIAGALKDIDGSYMPPLVETTQSFAKVSQSFFNRGSGVIKTTNSIDNDKTTRSDGGVPTPFQQVVF